MRALVAVLLSSVVLAACGAKSGSGPAWPRSAGRVEVDPEKDGGESLEPQHASHVSAIERADDRTPVIEGDAVVVEEKDRTEETKDETKPSPPAGEVQVEVIEVRPEDIQLER